MNLLRIFEGAEIKEARAKTDTLKRLVAMAKDDQRKSEDELRAKIARAMEDIDRPMIAGALTGRRGGAD